MVAKKASAEIYALRDPDTGEARYIGKANDAQKRLQSHISDSRRSHRPVNCWVRKLIAAGKQPLVTVECVAIDRWQELEQQLIAQHRDDGTRLLNLANGGDEPFCPTEVRKANALKMNQTMRPGLRAENARKMNATMAKDPIFLALRKIMCVMGQNIKFIESRGRADKAEVMRATVAKFKAAIKQDQDRVFGLMVQSPLFRRAMGIPSDWMAETC